MHFVAKLRIGDIHEFFCRTCICLGYTVWLSLQTGSFVRAWTPTLMSRASRYIAVLIALGLKCLLTTSRVMVVLLYSLAYLCIIPPMMIGDCQRLDRASLVWYRLFLKVMLVWLPTSHIVNVGAQNAPIPTLLHQACLLLDRFPISAPSPADHFNSTGCRPHVHYRGSGWYGLESLRAAPVIQVELLIGWALTGIDESFKGWVWILHGTFLKVDHVDITLFVSLSDGEFLLGEVLYGYELWTELSCGVLSNLVELQSFANICWIWSHDEFAVLFCLEVFSLQIQISYVWLLLLAFLGALNGSTAAISAGRISSIIFSHFPTGRLTMSIMLFLGSRWARLLIVYRSRCDSVICLIHNIAWGKLLSISSLGGTPIWTRGILSSVLILCTSWFIGHFTIKPSHSCGTRPRTGFRGCVIFVLNKTCIGSFTHFSIKLFDKYFL